VCHDRRIWNLGQRTWLGASEGADIKAVGAHSLAFDSQIGKNVGFNL